MDKTKYLRMTSCSFITVLDSISKLKIQIKIRWSTDAKNKQHKKEWVHILKLSYFSSVRICIWGFLCTFILKVVPSPVCLQFPRRPTRLVEMVKIVQEAIIIRDVALRRGLQSGQLQMARWNAKPAFESPPGGEDPSSSFLELDIGWPASGIEESKEGEQHESAAKYFCSLVCTDDPTRGRLPLTPLLGTLRMWSCRLAHCMSESPSALMCCRGAIPPSSLISVASPRPQCPPATVLLPLHVSKYSRKLVLHFIVLFEIDQIINLPYVSSCPDLAYWQPLYKAKADSP